MSSECALTTTVSAKVGAEVLLLRRRDGCEAVPGNGVLVETDVTMVTPAVLPAICCNNTVGGLAFGAVTLPTVVAEVVENVPEGKLPVLETMLPDVEA